MVQKFGYSLAIRAWFVQCTHENDAGTNMVAVIVSTRRLAFLDNYKYPVVVIILALSQWRS